MDLYKYVDDIKYNFDYSQSNMRKTRANFISGRLQHMKDKVDERNGISKEKQT